MSEKKNQEEIAENECKQLQERKELSVNQIKAIIAGILVVSFALSTFVHSDFMAAKRLAAQERRQEIVAQKQAEQEAKEAQRLEEARQAERAENLIVYKEQLTDALAEGDISAVRKYISYLEDDYGEHAWVREQTVPYQPSAPIPSISEGTYEANFTLSFTLDQSIPGNSTYQGEIHYEVSPTVAQQGGQLIFTENNTYSVTAYTTNQLGLTSEKVTYTYVLDKLVPNAVMSDLSSGYFNAPVTVSLSQDQGLPIYYTLDGSPVTTESTLYTGPITVTTGACDLRASAYSEVGEMFGGEAAYYYHITPVSSGLEANNMLLTSRGTFVKSKSDLYLIVNGQSSQIYEASGNIGAFCEYQNGILYTVDSFLYYMDLTTGESMEMGEVLGALDSLLRAKDRIFALTTDGELLYLQGDAWHGFLTEVKYVLMHPDGLSMYLVSGTSVSMLNTTTLEQTALFDEPDRIKAMAYGNDALFYTTGQGDFKQWDPISGEISVILSYETETESREPDMIGLFNFVDGYSHTTECTYTNVMCANGRVYVQKHTHGAYTTINYWNRSDRSTSYSNDYLWLVFDAETLTREAVIDVSTVPIIGDGYYAEKVGQTTFGQSYTVSEPAGETPPENVETEENTQASGTTESTT